MRQQPQAEPHVIAGQVSGGSMKITPEFLFASAVLMEIPMAMTLLSRVLGHRVNRWANVVTAAFMAVVQLASLTVGTPSLYYSFFTVIEVVTLVLIAVLALRWTRQESVVGRAGLAPDPA
jgi:hypothetical protein